MKTSMNSFLSKEDINWGKVVGKLESTLNSWFTGMKDFQLELLQSYKTDKNDTVDLKFKEVKWLEGESPLFNVTPIKSGEKGKLKESANIVKNIKTKLDRVFYIPSNIEAIRYAENEFCSHNHFGKSNQLIEHKIERFSQLIAWYIQLWDIDKVNSTYDWLFSWIRRELQMKKWTSELGAYMYIYSTLAPYIWISAFLKFIEDNSWIKPQSQDFFHNYSEKMYNDINSVYNESKKTMKNYYDFGIVRDWFLCWNHYALWESIYSFRPGSIPRKANISPAV